MNADLAIPRKWRVEKCPDNHLDSFLRSCHFLWTNTKKLCHFLQLHSIPYQTPLSVNWPIAAINISLCHQFAINCVGLWCIVSIWAKRETPIKQCHSLQDKCAKWDIKSTAKWWVSLRRRRRSAVEELLHLRWTVYKWPHQIRIKTIAMIVQQFITNCWLHLLRRQGPVPREPQRMLLASAKRWPSSIKTLIYKKNSLNFTGLLPPHYAWAAQLLSDWGTLKVSASVRVCLRSKPQRVFIKITSIAPESSSSGAATGSFQWQVRSSSRSFSKEKSSLRRLLYSAVKLEMTLRWLYLSNQDYNRFKSRLQIGQRKHENISS